MSMGTAKVKENIPFLTLSLPLNRVLGLSIYQNVVSFPWLFLQIIFSAQSLTVADIEPLKSDNFVFPLLTCPLTLTVLPAFMVVVLLLLVGTPLILSMEAFAVGHANLSAGSPSSEYCNLLADRK